MGLQVLGEGADGGEIGEVEAADLGVACNFACDLLALGRVADGEHDVGSLAASAFAVERPIPLLAPVMTNLRPACAGRSAAVHFTALHRSAIGTGD